MEEVRPEEIIKPLKGLRVLATKRVRGDDGSTFYTYRCVVNKKKKLMTLKFTRASGFPSTSLGERGINRFVLIEPDYNIDFNNLYPTVWVNGFTDISEEFDSFDDILNL